MMPCVTLNRRERREIRASMDLLYLVSKGLSPKAAYRYLKLRDSITESEYSRALFELLTSGALSIKTSCGGWTV